MISIIFSTILLAISYLITRDIKRTQREYYPDKKIKSKFQYIKIKGKKVQHGITTDYYENGNIKTRLEYYNGVLNGINTYFDEKGSIIKKEIYDGGRLMSTIITD